MAPQVLDVTAASDPRDAVHRVVQALVEGKVVNEIKVDSHTRKWATVALERMLAIKGTGNPIGKQQPAGTMVD